MRLSRPEEKGDYSGVWILAELEDGKPVSVTFELLGAARFLADARGVPVTALAIGRHCCEHAAELFHYGADTVVAVDEESLVGFNDELECRIASRLIRKYKPEILLGAATARGRALIPRIAVQTVSGLTADCTGLSIDSETGELLQTRPAFGGNILATIRTPSHRPQMATVRPRVMQAKVPDDSRTGRLIREDPEDNDRQNIKRVLETIRNETQNNVNLGDAMIIVSGGRAMKGPKGFDMLRSLAGVLGAAVGASRPCVDSGWIEYAHQIGQTGQTVQTRLYIACGISGQIQHLAGMQSCQTIIAIDKNPDTPMMQMADVAITGDLFEIVPALTEELSKQRG